MTFWEALELMKAGKRVRMLQWHAGEYMELRVDNGVTYLVRTAPLDVPREIPRGSWQEVEK